MTTNNPDLGNNPGLPEHFRTIHKVNDAMDELHIAYDLLELLHMASSGADESSIARGVCVTQDYLQRALAGLMAIRVALGGPDAQGGVAA